MNETNNALVEGVVASCDPSNMSAIICIFGK
jgi:hypothetical protein